MITELREDACYLGEQLRRSSNSRYVIGRDSQTGLEKLQVEAPDGSMRYRNTRSCINMKYLYPQTPQNTRF